MTDACSATRCRCGAARVKPLRRRVGDGGVPADSQPQRIGSPAKSACRATPRAACGVRRPGPALLSCRFMARACPLLVFWSVLYLILGRILRFLILLGRGDGPRRSRSSRSGIRSPCRAAGPRTCGADATLAYPAILGLCPVPPHVSSNSPRTARHPGTGARGSRGASDRFSTRVAVWRVKRERHWPSRHRSDG